MTANELAFGPRLIEQMNANGITMNRLSTITGVCNSSISNYTRNERFPGIPILVQIAKTLNCTTDYLCGLSDTPNTVAWSREVPFCPLIKGDCVGKSCAWFGDICKAVSSRSEQP